MRVGERLFTVEALAGNRWRVTSDASSAVAMFVARRDAIQYAHACAQAFRPSTVCVRTPKGEIEDVWRYGALSGIRHAEPDASTADASVPLRQRGDPAPGAA